VLPPRRLLLLLVIPVLLLLLGGVIIVAIKKASGKMVFNPSPETTLEAGDILIAIGDHEHLDRLGFLANG